MKDTDHAPESWARCSLKDIIAINPKNDASPEQPAGFVPMALAPTNYAGTLQHEEKLWGEIKKSYTNFADGDVIFAKVTPCFENGKAAIVRNMPSGIGAGSSEFYVLRPASKEISPSLLFAIIKTQSFMQQGAENMTGAVGLRRVPRAFVESFPISLPSAAEQKVIADKLDTLLAQVENTKARLERIPQILKRFRQSVLAAAVSGRLTEDWRSGDHPERSFKKLGDAGIEVKTGPFGSALHKSDYVYDGIPVINPMHISEGIVTPSLSMTISNEKHSELAAWHLREGDVVVGRRGEMGRAAAVKTNKKCLCGTGSMILRAGDNALPKYLEFILRSPTAVNYFNSAAVGSTMVNLNQKVVKSLEVYFPPLAEQAEIVRRVDQLFAHADRIEQQVNNALARVNNLTQSILAKAFRGELTEQWRKENPELISGENSAEALLEQIKAERAAMKPAQRTRKSKASG